MRNTFEILNPSDYRNIKEIQNETKTVDYGLRRTIVWHVVDSVFQCSFIVIRNIYTSNLGMEKELTSKFDKIVRVSGDGFGRPDGESIEAF